MPSAEPAPTPEPAGGSRASAGPDAGARIIPLTPRIARAAEHGGGADMTDPPQDSHTGSGTTGGGGEETILRPIAETLELRLQARHLTLADPRALDAVQAALEVAQAVMDGAHAQGVVDAEQSAALASMLDGVRRAADLGHREG